MVDRPTITPQRAPSIRGADLSVQTKEAPSLRNIGTVSAAGFDAAMNAAQVVESVAANARNTFDGIAKGIKQTELSREKEELEALEAEVKAQEELSQRVSLSSGTAFLSETNTGVAKNLVASSGTEAPIANHGAYVKGVTEELPPIAGEVISKRATVRAEPVLEEQAMQGLQDQLGENSEVISEAASVSEAEAIKYALPSTDAQARAAAVSAAEFSNLVDSHPTWSPAEKSLRKLNFRDSIVKRSASTIIWGSPSPSDTAVSVMKGETGIPELDTLPSEDRAKIFNEFIQVKNFMRAEEQAVKKDREASRDAARVNQTRAVLSDPLSSSASAKVQQLINSSKTQAELKAATDLRDKMEEEGEEALTTSKPLTLLAVEKMIANKSDDPNNLRRLLNSAIGNGIGTDHYNSLMSQIDDNENDLVSGIAYDNLTTTKARQVFPGAFSSKKQNSESLMIGMLMSGGDAESMGALLSESPEEQIHEEFYMQYVNEIRGLALSGEIATEQEYMTEGAKVLQRYQLLLQTNAEPALNLGSDVASYSLTTLNDTERRAFDLALQRPKMVNLVNNKYIKNSALVAEDLASGKINKTEARYIQALLMPVKKRNK